MAVQSLYRRFRPRKFSEMYGQEHVVKALRNAVIHGREGHAYLFSGPRGTGKTTAARILAKVLNCERPIDGEPCCECDSCRAVEAGTSYDVLELDAASHNGVQHIRDLIDSASLHSPGRHRVFILDEVHMLTAAAEAALLKTLEEPPDHVVFVLATTDPQKVSETIRSRTQHLQFHLLPMDELEKYVRHVVREADLTVEEDAISAVLRQGGGSARDTLSALELVVATGGTAEDEFHPDDIVRAIAARQQGPALAAIAEAMGLGRDVRTFTEDIVRTMRDCFLLLMSPDLVRVPENRIGDLRAFAADLGAQRIVQVMETLGAALLEMRHAPDARLLLEVSVVRLTSPAFDDSLDNVMARLSQLEEAVRTLRESGVAAAVPPAPVNPASGRAVIGGRAGAATGETRRPDASGPIARPDDTGSAPAPVPSAPAPSPAPPAVDDSIGPSPDAAVTASPSVGADPSEAWPRIVDSMKGFGKALFKAAVVESFTGKKVVVRMPPNTPMQRAEEQKKALIEAMARVCGATFAVDLVAGDPTAPGGIARPRAAAPESSAAASSDPTAGTTDVPAFDEPGADPTCDGIAKVPDISEFTETAPGHAPDEGVLKEMFPGAQVVEGPDTAGPATTSRKK